jgi:hypothetical protein
VAPSSSGRVSTAVYVEAGAKRVFASAAEWPGWCRAAKDEKGAIEALAATRPRYAAVAKIAGIPFAPGDVFDVVERLPGSATTDFGAPGAIAEGDARALPGKELDRVCALVEASWAVLDRVAAKAPTELRKGPRGGGRDRDEMLDHVLDADSAYAWKLGVKLASPGHADRAAIKRFHEALIGALRSPQKQSERKLWPPRYAARRIAWHNVDHAWEMEDRGRL